MAITKDKATAMLDLPKRYVIAKYLRISAEDIDLDGFEKFESNSIVHQRALLDDFIANHPDFHGENIEIIEALDDGKSGTNFSRDGVQKLIEMAQKSEVHCIICKDLSRWGRSYIEVGDFLEQKFPLWGVRFISIGEGYDSASLNGGTAGIDIAFRNLIYELYSQDLSEKVRSAKMSAAKSGRYTNAMSFYGYIKDPKDHRKLLVDEPAAIVVRRIFEYAAEGILPTQIAKTLNAENIPTPQQRKKELGLRRRWTSNNNNFWYAAVVSVILNDERYTGKLIYGKRKTIQVGNNKAKDVPKEDWVVVPDAIPQIMTEEQYNQARNYVSKRLTRSKQGKKNRTLLFTKKIKCGYCGISMTAVHRTHDIKYYCQTPKVTEKYGCSNDRVLESDISAAVLHGLQIQIAFADEAKQILAEVSGGQTSNVEKLKKEVMRLQGHIDKSKTHKMSLWEKYHARAISAENFQKENEDADEKVRKNTLKISELQSEINLLETANDQDNAFVERFSKYAGLQELTREVVEQFISAAKVYSSEKFEIIFNFADEYRMVKDRIDAFQRQKGRRKKTG